MPCSSHVHDISVNETSIQVQDNKHIRLSAEFKNNKSGSVVIGKDHYEFEFSEVKPGELNVIINGQVRKV